MVGAKPTVLSSLDNLEQLYFEQCIIVTVICGNDLSSCVDAVSYTHLTLPTNREV